MFGAALMAALLVAGLGLAAGETVGRYVLAGGGQRVSDGSQFVLVGTLGEPVAGAAVFAGNLGLGSGYWAGAGGAHRIYLPVVSRQ
jgi:hypothetical protein